MGSCWPCHPQISDLLEIARGMGRWGTLETHCLLPGLGKAKLVFNKAVGKGLDGVLRVQMLGLAEHRLPSSEEL